MSNLSNINSLNRATVYLIFLKFRFINIFLFKTGGQRTQNFQISQIHPDQDDFTG